MKASKRKRTILIVGLPFQLGFDARRHLLTTEERQRGGRTTWGRYMRRWRGEMGLPGGTPGLWYGEQLTADGSQAQAVAGDQCESEVAP